MPSSGASRAAGTSAKSSQTPEGEALRDDEHFAHAAAWEYGRRAGLRSATWNRWSSTGSIHARRSGSYEVAVRTATMKLNLLIWRQANRDSAGRMVPFVAEDVSPDMSFLEMLDVVNEG